MAVEQQLTPTSIIVFLIGLLVSTVVIYLVTFFTRHRRTIKLALFTAIIGSIICNCLCIISKWISFRSFGRNSLAFSPKSGISYGMVKGLDYGSSHMDYHHYYWCFITHCNRPTLILKNRYREFRCLIICLIGLL